LRTFPESLVFGKYDLLRGPELVKTPFAGKLTVLEKGRIKDVIVTEVTRRNTRIHFIQPLKERIVREVGYGLSLEGASAADLVKSMQAKSEPVAQKGRVA
jgi:hypothetical protein